MTRPIQEMFAELRARYPRPVSREQRRCPHPGWRRSITFRARWVGGDWATIGGDQRVCVMCGLVTDIA